jgi:hypothetical protein
MERPNEYKIEYVAVQDIPYQAPDPSAKGTHSGQGVCPEGSVIWLAKEIPASTSESQVNAWLEDAGIVYPQAAISETALTKFLDMMTGPSYSCQPN